MDRNQAEAVLRQVVLMFVGLAVLAAAAWYLPQWRSARAHAIRLALFEELKPVTLKNCTLKRYGGANDGGYLLCGNLMQGIQTAYSYGIDTEDNWGCDVSRELTVPVHQYDCFTDHRPTCVKGFFVFHDECVGGRTEIVDGHRFDTVANQVSRNGDMSRRLLVKMDIEGAEWDSLRETPDNVLDLIEQMPMELHGVNERRFLDLVRRLKTRFYLVNLHFNNWECTTDLAPMPSGAYQVLWVNKRVGVLDPDAPVPAPPSRLNAPDNPSLPECQIIR
jgi:hypothetical protein